MRIIFVGIHNKDGITPLDPKTFTGKIIQHINDHIDGDYGLEKVEGVVLSNLYDLNELPNRNRYDTLRWAERVKYKYDDIIVMLGSEVNKRMDVPFLCIRLDHPGSLVYKKANDRDEYIVDAARRIKEMIWGVTDALL